MNYETRKTTANETRARLQLVAEAGQTQGLWTITKFRADDETTGTQWGYAQLTTPAGHVYALTGGNYSEPGKLCINLTEHTQGAHRITPRDCYGMPTAEANISASRDVAAILSDITRRVLTNPENIACATAMLDRLAKRQDGAATLRALIAKVEAMGYAFRNVKEDEAHSATGCSTTGNRPQVTVYANGNVSFDASTTVDKLGAALAAL